MASEAPTETLTRYVRKIGEVTQGGGAYAYRGQENHCWPLHSAATRRLICDCGHGVLEDDGLPQRYVKYHHSVLIDPARRLGFGIERGRDISDLQLLGKLQHFGAATGLLDFTWNPLVALWFASQDYNIDGKLFAVNTSDSVRVARVPAREADQAVECVFSESDDPPYLSYWEPMVSGDAVPRILRQRSVFLIGRPLVPDDPSLMKQVTISKRDKQSLIEGLLTLDVDQRSLFQDIFGFAQANRIQTAPPDASSDHLREGDESYRQGEYLKAVGAYSKFIERNPDVFDAYLLRGNANAAVGKHSSAIEDYNVAIVRSSRLFQHSEYVARFNRANSKAELNDLQGAIEDYTKAIQLEDGHAPSYLNRGNAYSDLLVFDEAIADYNKVTGSGSAHAAFNKANALVLLGRFEEALQSYREAEARGIPHLAIAQNQWVLEGILSRIHGHAYDVHLDDDTPDAGLPRSLSIRIANDQRDPFSARMTGRAGNVGNIGGRALPGGGGFNAKSWVLLRMGGRSEGSGQ